MNADGTSGIDSNVRAGITVDWLLPLAVGLTIVGFVLLVGGTVTAVFAARGSRRRDESPSASAAVSPPRPTDLPPPSAARSDQPLTTGS